MIAGDRSILSVKPRRY